MVQAITLFICCMWCGSSLAFIARTSQTTCVKPRRNSLALNNADASEQVGVKIGFVGCGTIAVAIATGLARQEMISIKSITVSRRSKEKSSALHDRFPELVSVQEDNQAVLDNSDVVFMCVLPQQTTNVLAKLDFDTNRHTLVSLVSTSKLDELAETSGLDQSRVYKMICLPSVQRLEGTCLVVPKILQAKHQNSVDLKSLFQSLGGCVECETQSVMNAMMIPSAMMGPLYGLLQNNCDWLVKQGVPPQDASYFVGRLYWGMMQDAVRDCDKDRNRFQELIEQQTPAGLNEQALQNLKGMGVFDAYDKAMDAVLSRLERRSDGFLDKDS